MIVVLALLLAVLAAITYAMAGLVELAVRAVVWLVDRCRDG